MVSNEIAQGYLFLANFLNAAKIVKLLVPEVVQSGSPDVVLDCQFFVPDEQFTLQWWFTDSSGRGSLVYEWTPHSSPTVAGVLEGRLDSTYRVSSSPVAEYRAFRLLSVDPELSGDYTCILTSKGVQVRETKRMLVFRPEEEFELTINRNINSKIAEITCFAYGMYPQPDLVLENDMRPIAQQVQRVWHINTLLKYHAESKAELPVRPACARHVEVTCRLYLPQAAYTAIKKRFVTTDEPCNGGQRSSSLKLVFTLFSLYIVSDSFKRIV